jgi:pilus assembly protein CpaF
VSVNGSRVFLVTGDGSKRLVEHLVPDEAETLQLIKRAIGPLGGRLDESQPVVELSLPDGSRLTAVIPPMSSVVQLSIRRFVLRALTLDTLVSLGTLPEEAARFLEAAVRAGINVLIAGPTAAGKTTFINALGAAIPASKRVVSLEDARELRLGLPDHVPLYARSGNVEHVGAITYRKLMRTALRLRPDYLIVGEVRGAEAVDMLAAMATGHASFCTIHAPLAARWAQTTSRAGCRRARRSAVGALLRRRAQCREAAELQHGDGNCERHEQQLDGDGRDKRESGIDAR